MADNVVKDNETGLIWQDSQTIVKKDFNDAEIYCKSLSLNGYTNWRLPNIDELLSIVDLNRKFPAIKKIFKNTKTGYYWSSSKYESSISKIWYIDFGYGNSSYRDKLDKIYVRCVVGKKMNYKSNDKKDLNKKPSKYNDPLKVLFVPENNIKSKDKNSSHWWD